jgi:hypothetical protein
VRCSCVVLARRCNHTSRISNRRRPRRTGCYPLPLKMSMGAWVWMYDMNGALEEVVRYAAYSEKDSQLLEENYQAQSAKASTKLSLGGRKYIVRKTRKGWVQEVDGQPERWRAVKRVQLDGGTPPLTGTAAASPTPSPHGMAPTAAAASPNFVLLQLRDEREARQRTTTSSTTTSTSSPATGSSPAGSPPPSATQHQPVLLPLPLQQQRLHESNKVHPFRLCTVLTLPLHTRCP